MYTYHPILSYTPQRSHSLCASSKPSPHYNWPIAVHLRCRRFECFRLCHLPLLLSSRRNASGNDIEGVQFLVGCASLDCRNCILGFPYCVAVFGYGSTLPHTSKIPFASLSLPWRSGMKYYSLGQPYDQSDRRPL